ncbi:hypothetical protein FGE12_05760 [Aggregicoccus sp. 17bor-14]|uniref:hypothetical protein n=1 Tax=Myxococcaceae TaxID=31 RepID=UPI00129C8173|nr:MULTISPECIES: hypothetical protein [Myxococcaceae]MBF5041889.1 hypothetical protein [Simulacricoccus sp. 17bor-14]MRI87670.1 hypothetical protein [Aggregicoccus sp. 17bor-14]
MSGAPLLAELVRENAFLVLGLAPGCSRMEVEREGARLLAALELKLQDAAQFATPLGPEPRTPERVRRALADLRDPARRLLHEWVARQAAALAPADPAPRTATPWRGAPAALGFGRRRAP